MGLYISIVRVHKECVTVYQKCITVCVRSVSQCIRSVSQCIRSVSRCVSEVCHSVSEVYHSVSEVYHGVCQKCVTVCQKCVTVCQKCVTVYQKCVTVYQKCITVCVRSVSQCVRSVSEVVISRLTGEKAPKVPRSYQIIPDKCPKLSTKPLSFLSTLFGADAVENIFRRRNTPVFLSTIQGKIMSTPVIRLPAFGNILTTAYQYPYHGLPTSLPRLTIVRRWFRRPSVKRRRRSRLGEVRRLCRRTQGLAGRQAAQHGSNFSHQAVVTLRPSDVSGSLQPESSTVNARSTALPATTGARE